MWGFYDLFQGRRVTRVGRTRSGWSSCFCHVLKLLQIKILTKMPRYHILGQCVLNPSSSNDFHCPVVCRIVNCVSKSPRLYLTPYGVIFQMKFRQVFIAQHCPKPLSPLKCLCHAYNVNQVSSSPIWHATCSTSPELCKNHFYPSLATDRRKVDIRYDIPKANPSCLQTPLTPDLLRGVHFGLFTFIQCGASLVAQMVKNLHAMQENWVWSLGREDLLEKGMASHISILAWKIPWTEETGGLQSMEPESDMTEQLTLQFFNRGHRGFWEVLCQQTPKSPATTAKEGCRVGPVTSLRLFSLSLGQYRLP